jgi:gluconolactonase
MIFAEGLHLPEGPVLLDDGSWLVVELDMTVGTVTRVSADGRELTRIVRTGRPNGLAVEPDGEIWLAESLEPRVMRVTLEGRTETVFRSCAGRKLRWPNDLCIRSNRTIYLTDSGVLVDELLTPDGINPSFRRLDYGGGVYRWDLATGREHVIDADLQFANGIAFSPDGVLYVSESITGNVYRYFVETSDRPNRELFANVIDPDHPVEGWHGPDGMAFSEDGRLWVTVFGQGHVAAMDARGAVVERLRLHGSMPTNCAFGPDQTLYVVENEHGTIEAHGVGVDGLALHS